MSHSDDKRMAIMKGVEVTPPNGVEGFRGDGYPATSQCGHPPHAYLVDITCARCGVFKMNGKYLPTEGAEGLKILDELEAACPRLRARLR